MALCDDCAGMIDPVSMVCEECGKAVAARPQSVPGGSFRRPATTSTRTRLAREVSTGKTSPTARSHAPIQAAPFLPEVASASPTRPKSKGGWKVVIGILSLTLFLGVGYLIAVNRTSTTQTVLTVESIELRNTDDQGVAIGGIGTSFPVKDLDYLEMNITLRHNATGSESTTGLLGIKIIDPTGQLFTGKDSSGGYTMTRPMTLLPTQPTQKITETWGRKRKLEWGKKGTWSIELWWKEEKISTKTFDLN